MNTLLVTGLLLPVIPPQGLRRPPGLSVFLIIYGATVSSRKWGGKPEIIDFVLSLSVKGNGSVPREGVKSVSLFGFHES